MRIYSGKVSALAQCSPTTPGAIPLLGGTQGAKPNTMGLQPASHHYFHRSMPTGFEFPL